ncbi:MAG TPA: outer membrane protein assembly factor BamA [Phycisphaerae bacterium]|nr:outer membrane protein assembly factor BamA [Phycisphaerae bacterium]HRY68041.1 outer membrane protein assembly factor BamA [Phycisphaerae bacterium]HSA28679.1 outer membrane protein assembly factor BamA [Phycisphaerae bacterium]
MVRITLLRWLLTASFVLVVLAGVSAQQAPPTAAPAPAASSSPLDGKLIGELTIVGLVNLDEAYVRNQIRVKVGQAYSQDQAQRDVSRLLKTGRFLDVQADTQLVNDRVKLVIKVAEKPEVASVEFVGAKKFKTKDLIAALSFNAGDPLDLYDVRQGRDAIERLYKEKGYSYVEVTFDEELLKTERRVVYTIVENQRVRVRAVRFEGNTAYGARELKHEIETKAYLPIFITGDFDAERATRDAAKVQQYYRDRGYLDAEVSYVEQYTDVARERLEVVFRVSEGAHYAVKEIRIRGSEVFTAEEIIDLMRIKVGESLVDSLVKADVKKIQTHYGAQGYIYCVVTPSWVFADEPGQVILTMNLQEGEQFRVGWIEVNGNSHTQEKCVRRELRFYPDELYDTTKTEKAQRKLKETGLFSDATIEPIEPEDKKEGVRDAVVTVKENPKTNQFLAGIGASSDSGVVGNIVLENTNFDLFDTPRSFEEFIKGRAYRGAGQTFRIQLEPGTELTRFRIDFREPYLFDKRIGFGTSVYLFERGRDGYDELRIGGMVSFDKTFEQGLLKDWVGEIALRSEYINISDVESFAAKDIQDVEGDSMLTSAKLSLLHDTTNSRFDPSAGHRFNVGYEQAGALGGDYFFGKATAGFTQYWTVAVDDQDRKSVVSAYTRAGQIIGDAPVFERFYAGGIGSFRGFDFRGISPRDGLRNNRVGGDFMTLTGAEYSFPLYSKVVRGVFFSDMGTVEEHFGVSSWRASVGAGIRLTLEIFGTVPMEFDVAFPVAKSDEDDTRWFSFFIGLPFL